VPQQLDSTRFHSLPEQARHAIVGKTMATQIKGAVILNCIAFLRETASSVRYEKLVSQCPVETRQLLSRSFMAVEWLNVDLWTPFLQVLHDDVARRDEVKFRRLIRAVCQRDFQSVYRPYVQKSNPLALCGKLQTIWSAFIDGGTLSNAVVSHKGNTTSVVVHLRDLETNSAIMPLVIQAYLEQLLSMVGAKDCVVSTSNVARSASGCLSCEFEMSFQREPSR